MNAHNALFPSDPAGPLIGFGGVRHTRLVPVRNAFAYATYFLMLPMRSMQTHGAGALAHNRWAALSFYDRDHGDGRGPEQGGALAWLEAGPIPQCSSTATCSLPSNMGVAEFLISNLETKPICCPIIINCTLLLKPKIRWGLTLSIRV